MDIRRIIEAILLCEMLKRFGVHLVRSPNHGDEGGGGAGGLSGSGGDGGADGGGGGDHGSFLKHPFRVPPTPNPQQSAFCVEVMTILW